MNTQVVLITGGLTGIGRATALAFANEGAQVVVSGRHDEDGQKLVSEIRKIGAEAEFVHADVRHEEDVRNHTSKLRTARAREVRLEKFGPDFAPVVVHYRKVFPRLFVAVGPQRSSKVLLKPPQNRAEASYHLLKSAE
jgi:NAD(P)-dependent dehydrogenase (short-subunit alcohol dehydrogenase family)